MTNPTLTEKDVAEIAGKLSAQQRSVVMLIGPGDSRRAVTFYADVANRLCVATKQREALLAKHHVPSRGMSYTALPLGLAVRNHLISTPNMPKGDRA